MLDEYWHIQQENWIHSKENPDDKLRGGASSSDIPRMFATQQELIDKFPDYEQREKDFQEYLNTK